MLLNDNSGIGCDHCGTTHNRDFEYYSWDFRHVDVFENRRPSLDAILIERPAFSLDICAACFQSFKRIIVANYGKLMSEKRMPQTKMVCEWTGVFMQGNFEYYHVNVTKADVRLTGQPHVCTECNTKAFDSAAACKKCGSKKFICHASVETIQRFVELNISVEAFKEFTEKAAEVRRVAGEWATK